MTAPFGDYVFIAPDCGFYTAGHPAFCLIKKIRPFMDQNMIKVFTGIRRCGKSVMLELMKEELKERGLDESCFFSVNFET